MSKLICTLCDGTDLIKQEGVFVCQTCGVKYSVEDAKRIMKGEQPKASASSGKEQGEVEVKSVTETVSTIIAKNFRCNGCGTSLKIPQNQRGIVKCPACKNESILDGLVKNAEIAAKENINSGISLSATADLLHDKLVNILSNSQYAPLDVFEKTEVIKEERFCIPAFCFHCTGTKSFTYEKGVDKKHVYTDSDGKRQTETSTEWHPVSSSASVTTTLFAPGEKQLAPQIEELYMELDQDQLVRQLVDIEELEFPADVETYIYNYSPIISFDKYVKPVVEKQLLDKANSTLPKYDVRNAQSGGNNIQHTVKRVFLGLYCVIYKYDETEYKMWATGDGNKISFDSPPHDAKYKSEFDRHKSELTNKQNELKAIPSNKTGWLVFGVIVGVIIGLIGLLNQDLIEYRTIMLVIAGILIIVCAVSIPSAVKKSKQYEEQRSAANRNISDAQKILSDYEALQPASKKRFKEHQKRLKGIYERG